MRVMANHTPLIVSRTKFVRDTISVVGARGGGGRGLGGAAEHEI